MFKNGQLEWFFSGRSGCEVLTVTNLNEASAQLSFDVYFENREPVKGLTYTLSGERVVSFDLNKPFCDQNYKILSGVYSIVLHSNLPVVAVFNY